MASNVATGRVFIRVRGKDKTNGEETIITVMPLSIHVWNREESLMGSGPGKWKKHRKSLGRVMIRKENLAGNRVSFSYVTDTLELLRHILA